MDGSVPLFSQCHNRGPRFKTGRVSSGVFPVQMVDHLG